MTMTTTVLDPSAGIADPCVVVDDGITDPDMEQALQDRRALIEQRVRSVTMRALEDRQPWATQFLARRSTLP
jgi:hypothetical protein